MKKEEINRNLRIWFSQMLKKYTWLSIKYEFNVTRKCFLVSFSPESITSQNEEFSKDVLAFEDKMNEEYCDDAPLFCDGESLFKLSSNAEVLTNPSTSNSFVYEVIDFCETDFSKTFTPISFNAIKQNDWVSTSYFNNHRKFAA